MMCLITLALGGDVMRLRGSP